MLTITTSTFPLHLNSNISSYPNGHQCKSSLNPNKHQRNFNFRPITQNRPTIRRRGTALVIVEPSTAATDSNVDSAPDVVRKFYQGINAKNMSSVENLVADNCVYEDMVYPKPFIGRKAILSFFQKVMDSLSKDLQFTVDEISEEDNNAVGVTWHMEWKGKPFPFSKGCSFYKLEVVNGQRQIVYGRDIVEPSIKPGDMALVAISGVTWLLQKFPQLADRL